MKTANLIYALGQAEGMIKTMAGLIYDTQLTGYLEGKTGRFEENVTHVLEGLDRVNNYLIDADEDTGFAVWQENNIQKGGMQ